MTPHQKYLKAVMEKSFVAKCLDGEAFADEMDDYVDRWHDLEKSPISLREFLGLTEEEYVGWMMSADYIYQILEQRAVLRASKE